TAKVTSKGQLTLPKELRDQFEISAGDQVILDGQNGKEIRIRKSGKLSDLAGILHRPGQATVSIEKMKKSVADAINREGR
ncbi:MAG: AbrB/MazE/SpoVT family DNA-binding domain-containing protein, partial [Candidatus Omnitrophica bacterium]|nr:AbrB/MazE/SpoVT family DNA-binding domain-containing protein [Candidatus Omnitrophota bacterium]